MFSKKTPQLPDVVVNNETDIEGVNGVYSSERLNQNGDAPANDIGEFSVLSFTVL